MSKQPAVYILPSKRNGTFYVGVTSDLKKRVWKRKTIRLRVSQKYAVDDCVYYELHENMVSAITREKQMKKWNRAWKLELIEKQNSDWRDLWEEII